MTSTVDASALPRSARRVLAACAVALLAAAVWSFHASGCAENAAGATERSADLDFVGVVLGMAGIAPLLTLAAARPGPVTLRLLRGLIAWGLGVVLLLLVAITVPAIARCG